MRQRRIRMLLHTIAAGLQATCICTTYNPLALPSKTVLSSSCTVTVQEPIPRCKGGTAATPKRRRQFQKVICAFYRRCRWTSALDDSCLIIYLDIPNPSSRHSQRAPPAPKATKLDEGKSPILEPALFVDSAHQQAGVRALSK